MKIAVIGSGISGMSAAHYLSEHHEVTMFEAGNRLGGHTATIDVPEGDGIVPIDTGFIVFNDRTYPNFIALMDSLGIQSQPSCMSFSVSDSITGLEYAGTNLNTLFAQRRNLFRPSFLRMLRDILSFNQKAPAHFSDEAMDNLTLRDYLKLFGYSREFRDKYLVPMSAAIWSSSPEGMLDFPASFLVRFFSNHGLLTVNDRPQWRVIRGGSKTYIPALTARYANRIRLNSPVTSVTRISSGNVNQVLIESRHGNETFDQVVFACHSDQALRLLSDATKAEHSILSEIPYRKNSVVLHTDCSVMPDRKRCWSSWNVLLDEKGGALTYHMNRLQGLTTDTQYFVTLNPDGHIDERKVIDDFEYDHPVFTGEGVAAQQRWQEINGVNNTWFCGAYWRNGFHEDGVWSALRVAQAIGESSPALIQAA